MKIQTSRESHRTERRYSGVFQQQGRMITDADWNELMEIVTELRRESLRDVVQSGIPRDGGVKISLNGGVHIAPGCHLCGNVHVGAYSLLGVGTVVNPGVRIGRKVFVNAGTRLSKDVPDGEKVRN